MDKNKFYARSMEELLHYGKRLVAKAKQSEFQDRDRLIEQANRVLEHMKTRTGTIEHNLKTEAEVEELVEEYNEGAERKVDRHIDTV